LSFFPNVEPRQANINIQMPSGTNIEKTNEFTKSVENRLKPYEDIEFFVANVGSSNNPMDFGGSVSNKSTITVNFYDKMDRKRSSFESMEDIRNAITGISGGDINIQKQAMGPPTDLLLI